MFFGACVLRSHFDIFVVDVYMYVYTFIYMAAGLLLLGLPRTTTGTWIDAFFWLSFSAFVVVFPAVLYRVHAHPTLLEDHHQLQYPLLAAPAAVLLIAWIALGGHQVG
jgi:hypothetical protein